MRVENNCNSSGRVQISVSSLRNNATYPPLRFPPFSGRLSFGGDNRGPRLIMS